MPGAVSSPLYDSLFSLYMAIGLVVGALVLGWLAVALWRFRAKGGADPADAPRPGIVPRERGGAGWIVTMSVAIALVLFALSFGTLGAVDAIEHAPRDENAIPIAVTAFQFGWSFRYQEGFETYFDLTVPVDRTILLDVTSQDVMHNFAIPEYRLRVDAIPGRVNHLWFKATETGVVRTVCVELCGTGHATMKGTIVVLGAKEYDAWVAEKSGRASAAPVREVKVTAKDGALSAPSGAALAGVLLRVTVENAGGEHVSFSIGNASTGHVMPGATGTLELTPRGAEPLVLRSDGGSEVAIPVVEPRVVSVTLLDFEIVTGGDRPVAGEPTLVRVTNAGGTPHDLSVGSWSEESPRVLARTPMLAGGESAELLIEPEGPLDVWCGVPGHAGIGMKGTWEVDA